jgi:anti-anti-sigma regulatory factor
VNHKGPVVVKDFPQSNVTAHRRIFLNEVQTLADQSYRPQLIVKLPSSTELGPAALDLLLDCVERVERVDGRVSVAAGSPEAEVILELTRLTSVVDMFASVSEAMGDGVPGFEPQIGSQVLTA